MKWLLIAGLGLVLTGCAVRSLPEGGYAITPSPFEIKPLVSGSDEAQQPTDPPSACHAHESRYGEWLAGKIVGQTPGSRVNIRAQPHPHAALSGYGLVGDQIAIMGEAVAAENCSHWYRVQFPKSGHQGYIHSDFVRANP